jgi:hypothetical protein
MIDLGRAHDTERQRQASGEMLPALACVCSVGPVAQVFTVNQVRKSPRPRPKGWSGGLGGDA